MRLSLLIDRRRIALLECGKPRLPQPHAVSISGAVGAVMIAVGKDHDFFWRLNLVIRRTNAGDWAGFIDQAGADEHRAFDGSEAKLTTSKYRLASCTLAASLPLVSPYHCGQPPRRPTSGPSMSHPAGTAASAAVMPG